jgi:hypothetical protein
VTEHPGEQFPPDVDPDVEPGFDPYPSEDNPETPDYDAEPAPQDFSYVEQQDEHAGGHVDPAEVEFGPEFARAPGQEHEHPFAAEPAVEEPAPAEADDAVRDEDGERGHPLVEETMARLDELRDRPVGEHADVYADLHERLQSALVEADADSGDRG